MAGQNGMHERVENVLDERQSFAGMPLVSIDVQQEAVDAVLPALHVRVLKAQHAGYVTACVYPGQSQRSALAQIVISKVASPRDSAIVPERHSHVSPLKRRFEGSACHDVLSADTRIVSPQVQACVGLDDGLVRVADLSVPDMSAYWTTDARSSARRRRGGREPRPAVTCVKWWNEHTVLTGQRNGFLGACDLRARSHIPLSAWSSSLSSVSSVSLSRSSSLSSSFSYAPTKMHWLGVSARQPTFVHTASIDGALLTWDVRWPQQPVLQYQEHVNTRLDSHLPCSLSASGNLLYAVGSDCVLRLFETRCGQLVDTVPLHDSCGVGAYPRAMSVCDDVRGRNRVQDIVVTFSDATVVRLTHH